MQWNMEKRGKDMEVNKEVYRVQGFTCANCAAKFEKNVKEIDGVEEAKVNFGAAKLTVYGKASLEQLEKAGSFEGLKLYHEKEKIIENQLPFWQRMHVIRMLIGGILLILGVLQYFQAGEEAISTIALFAASMVIGGYPLFMQGLRNLLKLRFDMKTLMTVAIIGAVIIGEWAEGAVVVFLFAISEVLERYSMDKARRSIRSLMEIAPNTAIVRRDGKELELDVENIKVGDLLIVKPGQKIAMDGLVVKGRSTINQAAITGESVPVTKTVEDQVYAGTLNEEGLLEIKVTKKVEDTTLAKIIHLVEEAQAEKAPSQAFVDRFAKYYTPLIMVIALAVAVVPPLFLGADWSTWIYQGLAVLVVGCPCALVISTPVAIVTAIGNAARNGVLIKGGVYLEEIGAITSIAFDKTGTLTKGVPAVTDYRLLNGSDERNVWRLAAALEQGSGHPLAKAIVHKAEELYVGDSWKDVIVHNFLSVTGKGVQATINGEEYYIGSPSFILDTVGAHHQEEVAEWQAQGKTVIVLATNQKWLAIFAVADEVREISKEIMAGLRQQGIRNTVMLTGDNRGTAAAIGKLIGMQDVKSELLPEQKLSVIKELQGKYGKVAMVGDGVNDAPALAAANVGIAMGGAGTDTALETADIALMGDDLSKLPFAIRLSRKALAVIKQNIAFSLGLKLLALLLVIPGWLTLWIAIFADMGATLLVTLNGLRLLKVKAKK